MNIKVIGAEGTISDSTTFVQILDKLGKKYQIMIQCVNAAMVFSSLHIISAVEHAVRAFEQQRNATANLGLEVLLYIAGERQIHRAIDKVGIHPETTAFVLVLVGDLLHPSGYNGQINDTVIQNCFISHKFRQDNNVIKGDRHTLQRFGISPSELSVLTASQYEGSILEKVAMVDVIK